MSVTTQGIQVLDPLRKEEFEDVNAGPGERARAVARLFEEHNRALVSFLTLRLHSQQDAKEVAQEAYVRLLQLDRTGAVSFLRAYLFRIAANLAVDRIRQQRTHRAAEEHERHFADETDEAAAPERMILAREELETIRKRLSDLPPRVQEAFLMHTVQDRPTAEIALEMKLTPRMVRYYVARGLAVCREVQAEARKRESSGTSLPEPAEPISAEGTGA